MTKIIPLFLLASLFILPACGLLGSDNEEKLPDIPGKIVFAAEDETGTSQIFTMNANGSDINQLTDFSPSGAAVSPSWSPDGKRIIFSSFKMGTSDGPALWVMDADGSDQRVLYDPEPENPHMPPIAGNNAKWNPDGKKVVYDLCLNCNVRSNNDIYVFDTDTKEITQLTTHPSGDLYPTWSPDGTRIAFVSNRDYLDADTLRFRKDLYVMNVDGTGLQRLTKTGYAREPRWKPSSDTIIFRSTGSAPGLYKVDTKSREIVKVKDDLNDRTHLHPNAWSPNGRKLLITARQLDPPNTNSLYVFDMANSKFEKIYSKSSNNNNQLIIGADLFAP